MQQTFENMLYRVEKPARYIGGEINSVKKTKGMYDIHFGFSFPDVYEVGMSYLGLHILYNLLNYSEHVYCERVFAPWPDMEAQMRENDFPLFTLETKTPVKELDILAFTLQYELSYTNILNMLDMGRIPMKSKDRSADDPLIFAGGPCAYNPEPIAEFVDLFMMGEGEEVLPELMNLYREMVKAKGASKVDFLKAAAGIKGVYVPMFYETTYNSDGTIAEFAPTIPEAPARIIKRIIENLDEAFYPERVIVPATDIVHDRAMIELFRGCTKGCRFCQAGMIYRPLRERSVATIEEITQRIVQNTGFDELSLMSLSTLDYSKIKELVFSLIEKNKEQMIGLSLPSLRLDSFSIDILQEIQKVRKTGLTFAPEAGTQRLRDVINKGVAHEDIKNTMIHVFGLGWNKVKLYFMMGLPTETYEDLDGINEIGNMVTWLHSKTPREQRRDGLVVTISTSCFVPKPFTPFQWEAQDTMEVFKEKQHYLRGKITNKKVKFNYHDAETSFLEGVIARGDRRVGALIQKAWEMGCKFDGWQEYFDFEKWTAACEATGIDPSFYANRKREYTEVLPWDFIDIGVTKGFLMSENEASKEAKTTHDCRKSCVSCGVNAGFIGGECF